ncbi:MAG TPA: glycosyltransferase family 2 protein [Terriglobales bacterium]|nr:glycosyltransferase family 2 protein [Terriglobales bacterium]
MTALHTIFWCCAIAVAYNYAGYPALLFCLSTLCQAKTDCQYLLRRTNRRCSPSTNYFPRVAILVSAYNEETVISAKVENTRELDYPNDRLEVWFGLDAPSDSTGELLKEAAGDRMRVVEFPHRRGKLAVLMDLARQTTAEIIVLTDANTMLDRQCVRNLVRHFRDPQVAAVSGEEIRKPVHKGDSGGESMYWRYESAIKILESRLNCAQGGNGAALAMRRCLFEPEAGSIVEDFQIPLELRFRGHRVVYDPEAIAIEEITPNLSAQFARRVRIGAGNYQTLFRNPHYLNPCRGLLTFTFISHRLLRWVTPLCLTVAFLCSFAMIRTTQFAIVFVIQCLFYSMAVMGYVLSKRARPISLFSLPLNFCSMNLALLLGFWAYVTGRQGATWSATPRASGLKEHIIQLDADSGVRPAA